MMYHLKFGFDGAAAAAVWPSAVSADCGSAASVIATSAFTCSSLISSVMFLSRLCPREQVVDQVTQHAIHSVKEDGEQRHRHDDHAGGSAHFFHRRHCDLAHLCAHVS